MIPSECDIKLSEILNYIFDFFTLPVEDLEEHSFSEDDDLSTVSVNIIKSTRGSFQQRSKDKLQTTCIIGRAIAIGKFSLL